MKTICIYHRIDLDGWMSAAVVKHWFNQQEVPNKKGKDCNTLDFLGWNYGDEIPDLLKYNRVIMCDVSFPKEEMLKLWSTIGLNFLWIDHHVSAIKEMENAHENISSGAYPIQGFRDVDFAACELTWMYFFDRKESDKMPEIVRLLGRYDCFGHKGTDEEQKVLEFQYGARSVISNYEDAYRELIKSLDADLSEHNGWVIPTNVDYIYTIGISIYNYLCTDAKQTYKNGFEIFLLESKDDATVGEQIKKFVCVNRERFNPINFGIDYHSDGYDGAACFHYDGNMWNFSLYNDNGEVDCSKIAKMYDGGGHRGAAGFKIKELTRIIN